MSRLVGALAAILLVLLLSQAVLAQYGTSGTLVVSPATVTAGGQVTVSGTGYGPNTQVQLSTQQDPTHLGTATADATGAFTAVIKVPSSFLGRYDVLATGIDGAGSVYVLSGAMTVVSQNVEAATSAPTPGSRPWFDPSSFGSDPLVLAVAGAAIVAMTGFLLFIVARRRRA
jgi:hypothetical protein